MATSRKCNVARRIFIGIILSAMLFHLSPNYALFVQAKSIRQSTYATELPAGYVLPTMGDRTITQGPTTCNNTHCRDKPDEGAIDINVEESFFDSIRQNIDPIFAPADGIVTNHPNNALYGNYVSIVHENGSTTYLAHLKEFRRSNGDHVLKGEMIGVGGDTGNSTGSHVHWIVRPSDVGISNKSQGYIDITGVKGLAWKDKNKNTGIAHGAILMNDSGQVPIQDSNAILFSSDNAQIPSFLNYPFNIVIGKEWSAILFSEENYQGNWRYYKSKESFSNFPLPVRSVRVYWAVCPSPPSVQINDQSLLGLPNQTRADISTCNINPPPQSNDSAYFVSDITLPDGTVVSPGQALTKTWRVKNVGTSTWEGFKLKFISGEQIGGPSEITLPTTAPGAVVDITINLVSPSITGLHNGSWQIVNQSGTWVPGGQLWVKIETQTSNPGSGQITMFDVSPSSPSSASAVHVVGRIKPSPNFRSMRFVMGIEIQEMTNFKQIGDQYEISADFDTASLVRGEYAIVFEVAKTSDPNWANVERQVKTYTLIGAPVSENHAPDRPILKSPYDWYLKDSAGASASVELCAYLSSDPDGGTVQYLFEVKDQGGGVYASSGWHSSACWTHTYAPNTYSWRVKTGDGSAESDWSSETWHFSVAGGGVYMGSHSFFDVNTDNTHLCVFVTYDGIQAPDVRAWINEAPDGSENGKWRLLDHYGPNTTPDCTQSNYHGFWIRSTRYETGNHAIRITAVKPDSGNSATKTTNYNIAYIRPPAPDLIEPATFSNNGTWWNTRSIHFEWNQTLRADNYTLRVSTNSNPWADPSPILNQTLGSGVTAYDYTFGQDYSQLYWSVQASNSAGSADSGGNIWFGIDLVPPACQVEALPSATYSNVFQVNWNSMDNSAGIQSSDIQFMDSERGAWDDWLINMPSEKTYDLFNGQPGHTYFFRCRASDRAGNAGDYPASADTSIRIDPFSQPGTPWWNHDYGAKRNIVILNNMAGTPLPQGYPIHLHFDGSTTPTAATIYAASLSSPKCNDLRIIYNDAIELNRIVDTCTSAAIDIWFRTQVGVPGGTSDNAAHQIYFGNSSATNPPTDRNHVFYPAIDSNHLRVFDMREGTGTTLYDATGNASATMGPELTWTTAGKFGRAVLIPGDQTPEPRYAIYAGYGPQPTCDFSAELWLKRLSGHQYGGQLIQQEVGYSNPWRWMFTLDGNKLRLAKEGVSDAVLSNGSLGDPTYFNNWHHIAVTYNCSGQVKFYIDGQLDSIKYFSAGGLQSASAPLRIGNSAYNSSRLAGYISGVAVSNVVRPDFTYGSFATITNEPTVATDSVITPPVTGAPDLIILSLSTYPNTTGGVLIEAIIQNQGDLSSESGFYTDLYLDHVPTGPGDYTGSLRFWINDPIDPGEIVTLTTLITDLSSLLAPDRKNYSDAMAVAQVEKSGTLYAQTDSAGLVQEPNNQNNIHSTGVQVCTTSPDTFENDNAYTVASLISVGNAQTHNFYSPGDRDWVKFSAQAGKTYRLTTSGLDISSDTHLYLYGANGTTLIASNDDYNNTLASQIEWTAPQNGVYYVRIQHWNPNVGGCGTSYAILLSDVSAPKPGAFNKLTPTNAAVNQLTSLTLSWETSAGATTYEYCYDTTNDNTCSPWVNNGTSTSKSLTGLAYNTSYYWRVRARNANGVTYSNGSYWSFKTKTQSSTFRSVEVQDGWILESSETSNVGGVMNSTVTTIRLGDNATRKQYRSIISFDTGAGLPDTAIITKVTLKLRQQAIVGGGNPVTLFQGFVLDMRKGTFGTSALQVADWQAPANKTYGPFTPALTGGWYTFNLTNAKAYINKLATGSGLTQIRLRFKLDNNNAIANYLSLYSGNAGAASRPQLIIEYYVP